MYAKLLGAHGPTSEEADDEEEQQFTQQLDQYLWLIVRQTNHLNGGNKTHAAFTFWHHSPENVSVHPPPLSERVFSEVSQRNRRNRLTVENAERLFGRFSVSLLTSQTQSHTPLFAHYTMV